MKSFGSILVCGLFGLICGTSAQAQICAQWSAPADIVPLDTDMVSEASGLAASSQFADRIYLNNDSGDGPFLYMTSLAGGPTQKIEIQNFAPLDNEDLAYGNCPLTANKCIYMGDIGDNKKKRTEIEIVVIEEKQNFPSSIAALHFIRVKYPDHPHNAEAMALHPNGDLYILTKEMDEKTSTPQIALIYKLTATQLANKNKNVQTLSYVGELDIPFLTGEFSPYGQIITAADISADGKKLLVLTYEDAIEFDLDLTNPIPAVTKMKTNVDFRLIPLQIFPQQEAITYLPGKNSFIYTTEFHQGYTSALRELECLP
jgi:hypothetical protein